jgi:hypothetical protein
LAEGMNINKLMDHIIEQRELFKTCFVMDCATILTPEAFFSLLVPRYSEDGSNREDAEVNVYKNFCDFIEASYHDGIKLSIFLYFTINIKYHLLTRDTYIVLVA